MSNDTSSPAPQKVPTAQAQAVFLPGAGSLIAGRVLPHPLNSFQQLGIEHRGGDAVHSAGPFPEVDGLAVITAEGKIRILGGDDLPARRTAQGFEFFRHHNVS